MMYQCFSIYDSKVFSYSPMFSFRHVNEATRWFTEMVQKPDSNFCKYPLDFTLFHLGTYDDETASFSPHHVPISLGTAHSFMPQASNFEVPKDVSRDERQLGIPMM